MSKFKPVELNEENVERVFKECVALPEDKEDDLYESSIYMQNLNKGTVRLSKSRLDKMKKTILYMIGQFYVAHHSSPISMYPIEGLSKNYKGLVWTNDLYTSLMIPTLARYFDLNSPMMKVNERYYLYTRVNDIRQTLSPNDPNFKLWWKEHRMAWDI